ncbi:MAG: hypothetical protein IKB70_12575 [Bacilli bacterium]|nr:hypothetical protein [Bacilli bacterium]
MGVIIHYDFRKQERQKEMREIQERVADRLINFVQDPNYYADTDVTKQIRQDNLRYMELEREEREWGGRDKWVEQY